MTHSEHQPTTIETTPMMEDPESTPKFSVGNYVTVLPDTKLKSKNFWGFQGYVAQVHASGGEIM